MEITSLFWTTSPIAISVLLGWALAMINPPHEEFIAARICFWASAIVWWGTLIVWGTYSDYSFLIRSIIVGVLCAIGAVALMQALRVVARREDAVSNSANKTQQVGVHFNCKPLQWDLVSEEKGDETYQLYTLYYASSRYLIRSQDEHGRLLYVYGDAPEASFFVMECVVDIYSKTPIFNVKADFLVSVYEGRIINPTDKPVVVPMRVSINQVNTDNYFAYKFYFWSNKNGIMSKISYPSRVTYQSLRGDQNQAALVLISENDDFLLPSRK